MANRESKEYFDITELRPPILSLPITREDEEVTREVIGSRGDKYQVDLAEMTCTCPDWSEDRIRFKPPDIRRACKHIIRQFSYERFVLKGEGLAGRLLPVPTAECRFGSLKINGSLVLFCCEPKRRLYFGVIAEVKGNDVPNTFANFRTDMYRWFERPVPKYSEQIKRYLRNWLKNQPEFEEVLPPLPIWVAEKIAERERQLEQQEKLDKEKCFVCGFQLQFIDKRPEQLKIACSKCSALNILTQSGKTNTVERLALYRKYDGDLYDKKIESLLVVTEREFEQRLRSYREMKAIGGLTEYEFTEHKTRLEREKEMRLLELRREKEIELEAIRSRERELRRISTRNQAD